jgi:hypothetical protein
VLIAEAVFVDREAVEIEVMATRGDGIYVLGGMFPRSIAIHLCSREEHGVTIHGRPSLARNERTLCLLG